VPTRGRAGCGVAGLAVILVGCGALVAIGQVFSRLPDRDRADEIFGGPGRTIFAYEVWDGEAHILIRFAPDQPLHFDHLLLDWISIEWPPVPAWQLTGMWYSADPTTAPASWYLAPCTGVFGELCDKDTELFGQINAPEIATLEVLAGGRRYRFPVAPPGFAVRLDGFRGRPESVRWLDAAGRTVWPASAASGPVRRSPGAWPNRGD
jgi:hypothetical protein